MKAFEIMTLGVVTVRPEATLKEATCLMLERGVSGLPASRRTSLCVHAYCVS
jgi:CBS domain-containing protein